MDYIINVVDSKGFSWYSTITIREIIKIGDTYNIITENGDIFISEDNSKFINSCIIYKNNEVMVYIEKI